MLKFLQIGSLLFSLPNLQVTWSMLHYIVMHFSLPVIATIALDF